MGRYQRLLIPRKEWCNGVFKDTQTPEGMVQWCDTQTPQGGWALPEISQTSEGMVQWCIQRYSDPEELVQ